MQTTEADPATSEAADPGHLALETERLLLRPLEEGDVEIVRRLAGEWEVARFLAQVPYPYSAEAAAQWIKHTRRGLSAGTEVTLAVTRKVDGILIGAIGVTLALHGRSGSLGYWIGRPYWGAGFATEAGAAMLAHAFSGMGLDRVTATALSHNKASQRVLEKIGLKYEREGASDFPARGGLRKVSMHGATKSQYLAETAGNERLDSPSGEDQPEPRHPDQAAAAVPSVLVSAVALIDPDNRVLLAQRPAGKSMAGLWEFPGGKVQPGETPEAALIRELREELGIDTAASCLAPFTFASHAYPDFHLLMPLYLCRRWQGTVRGREGQRLVWVRPVRLADYPMPPADVPLVAMLRDFL